MIIAETILAPETGEYGYLLALGEDYEWLRVAIRLSVRGPIGSDGAHPHRHRHRHRHRHHHRPDPRRPAPTRDRAGLGPAEES